VFLLVGVPTTENAWKIDGLFGMRIRKHFWGI
jgi:hypothetical protein